MFERDRIWGYWHISPNPQNPHSVSQSEGSILAREQRLLATHLFSTWTSRRNQRNRRSAWRCFKSKNMPESTVNAELRKLDAIVFGHIYLFRLPWYVEPTISKAYYFPFLFYLNFCSNKKSQIFFSNKIQNYLIKNSMYQWWPYCTHYIVQLFLAPDWFFPLYPRLKMMRRVFG